MKILLVAIRSEYFPVGIAYISAALKRAGHDVSCTTYENSGGLNELLRTKFDYVATGGLSSQYADLKDISEIVRKHNIKLIVGGGIITSEPELMTRALLADYAVIGEGEETIVNLLSTLGKNGQLNAVDGIGYLDNNQFILTKTRKQIEDLDSMPCPDYDSFDFGRKLDSAKSSDQYHYDLFDFPREYPIITSRSCPYLCTFCYHPIGDRYRQRSVDSIMQELEYVIPKYHINILSIYDELFSYNEKRVYEFCLRFKAFTDTLPWDIKWTCQMRVTGLKDTMLDAMHNAGCYMVSYGFESYNPVVLKSMKKGITPQQIHHAIHSTIGRNISIQANFIFGDRAETLETARETLEFWKDHQDAGILLAFIFAIPNSALYQYCIERGIIKDKLDFIKNHLYDILNMTQMPDADFFKLRALVTRYAKRHHIYSVPINRTLSSVSVRCPHCKKVVTYNNFVMHGTRLNKMTYCRICRRRFFIVSRMHYFVTKLSSYITVPFFYRLRLAMKQARKKYRNKSSPAHT